MLAGEPSSSIFRIRFLPGILLSTRDRRLSRLQRRIREMVQLPTISPDRTPNCVAMLETAFGRRQVTSDSAADSDPITVILV
jgi:hypothetical protein